MEWSVLPHVCRGRCIDHHAGAQCRWCTFDGIQHRLTGPREAGHVDGPEEFHLVIVDNGRSEVLASEFRDVLRCIRCGACMNTCPAYRHIGGHGYGSIYPWPIGAVISRYLAAIKILKIYPTPALYAPLVTACVRCVFRCQTDFASSSGDG